MRTIVRSPAFVLVVLGLAFFAACSGTSLTADDGGPADGAPEAGAADTSTADAPHDATAADSPADGSSHDAADGGSDATPAESGSGPGDSGADGGDASADAADSGADGGDASADAADSSADASDASADASDSGADASDASADASDSGVDASDANVAAGDGGPLAAGTYACGVCDGGACGGPCAPGMLSCGGTCVVAGADRANCGACGHACTGTDECVLGVCTPRAATVVASGLSGVIGLAVDAKSVYFVDGAGVHAVPKAGGAVRDLAPATGNALRVAVDDTYAYWSEHDAGVVMRAPKDGSGAPAPVVQAASAQGLVVVGSTVYWVNDVASDLGIHQAPAAGGAASVFATVDDTAHSSRGLQEIVTDGASLYVVTEAGAWRVPILAGGTSGPPVGSKSFGVLDQAGVIAGRPNEFCGSWAGLGGLGINCYAGGLDFQQGESFGRLALPACGLVYWYETGFHTDGGVYVVSDPDLFAGRRAQRMLTTDQSSLYVPDGMGIVFFNGAGEIRALPVP